MNYLRLSLARNYIHPIFSFPASMGRVRNAIPWVAIPMVGTSVYGGVGLLIEKAGTWWRVVSSGLWC